MTNEPAPPATPDGADPSMEEILASIRRILNDDDAPAEAADGAAPGGASTEDDDVLVLDESMLVSTAAPPASHATDAEPADTTFPGAESEDHDPMVPAPEPWPSEAKAPEPEMEAIAPAACADPRDRPAPTPNLVAPETAAAAASSVDSLVRTLAAGRTTQIYGGGPTLEDMVRAELRPMLKVWLDMYLPPMVERLVRTEIERVVGREVS